MLRIADWVAAVWALYRKAVILLTNHALRCAAQLPHDHELNGIALRMQREVQPVVLDVLSSVPYFLLADVDAAFDDERRKSLKPGPPVGGMLLVHPLYITVLQRDLVTPAIDAYVQDCFDWMHDWLGIGQAKVVRQAGVNVMVRSLADAQTIIWAGMII